MAALLRQALSVVVVLVAQNCKWLLLHSWSKVPQLLHHLWGLNAHTVGWWIIWTSGKRTGWALPPSP
jgi:hypothetical protein